MGLAAESRVHAKMRWAVDREKAAEAEPDALPLIRNGADLDKFLQDYFGIRLPNVQVCPEHSTPHDAFHAAYFATHPISVWKASRGLGGKSFTLSLLGLTEALTLRADVNVLGGSGEQSQRILESMGKLWAFPTAPRQFLTTDPGTRKTSLVWGNTIKALMASQTSVRGPHPQRLRLDEVDEMKLGILDSALGQPMSKGDVLSQIVISSTHQYPDGTMTEVLKRAGAKNWPVFEWCLSGSSEVLTDSGPVRMDALEAGTKVWAFDGATFRLTPVTRIWSNGVRRTIRITTGEGGILECTPEHRIRTVEGWRHAGTLRPGDRIVSGEHLSMRPAKATAFEDLPSVLPRGAGESESTGTGQLDPGTGNRAVRPSAFVAGSQSGRTAVRAGLAFHDVLSGWALRLRFLLAGLWNRDRSLRPPSPETPGRRGAGSGQGGNAGGDWDSPDCPVRPGSTPVVSIDPGPTVEVWDLSLPEHHAFLANGLVVHNCYHETKEPHGWLKLAEIERLRSVITDLMWRTEYELQEPTGENRAIDQDAVARMFLKELVQELKGDPEGDYAHGADWARKTNRTFIVTVRKPAEPDEVDEPEAENAEVVQPAREPLKVAALTVAERQPWPTMVAHLERHVHTFPGPAVHDGTGVGDVVAGYLNVEAEAFLMVGKARADLLTEYIHGIEHGEIVYPDDGTKASQIAKKEHKFATWDDLFGSGHLPDSISAGALAYRAAKRATGGSGRMKDPEPSASRGGRRSILQTGFRRTGGIFQRNRR